MDAAFSVADLVRDGLLAAVWWAAPLALAAVAAALTAGFVAARLGVTEPGVAAVVRAAAVLGTVALLAGTLAERTTDLGRISLSQLSALGQGRPVSAP
jgi:hypothetical protein